MQNKKNYMHGKNYWDIFMEVFKKELVIYDLEFKKEDETHFSILRGEEDLADFILDKEEEHLEHDENDVEELKRIKEEVKNRLHRNNAIVLSRTYITGYTDSPDPDFSARKLSSDLSHIHTK
jgi:hypothetical protein